jgi:predicted NAD-dependent protein-ADP-ribosyltransferase YbiA (DUF1768 family)
MELEIESIHKNKTWELTWLLVGNNPITSKWVFKFKKIANGEVDKLKAILVARGFQQCKGLDFDETFAAIVKWQIIRTLVVIASKNHYIIKHLNIKTTFLNEYIEEKVFMY